MGEEGEDETLENFLKWASNLGVSDSSSTSSSSSSSSSCCLGHSLCVSFFPLAGGRGLGAAREIRKGELILRVRKSALMTRESLLEKDPMLSSAVNKHSSSLSSIQKLAVCLLYEMGKGRKSFWYSYLMQLPQSYDILATFGPFELKALQIDEAIWVAEKAVSQAESDWREVDRLMEDLKLKPRLRTLKAWLWASATISSRTLHIPWDDAGCLCPVGDFFNYAAPGADMADTDDLEIPGDADADESDGCRLTDGGYEECHGAYCFYARKNYRKGEQVLVSYGTYTNLELLEHYGFLLHENPNDKFFIPLGPDSNSSLSFPTESLYIHPAGTPSFALLCTLRLQFTPQNKRKSIAHLVFSGLQVSPENEIKVMEWISSKCQEVLCSFPSSIEDDLKLLSAIDSVRDVSDIVEPNGLPPEAAEEFRGFVESNRENRAGAALARKVGRWKMAIEWRIKRKKSLVDCICFCDKTIEALSSNKVVRDYELRRIVYR